MPPGHKFSSIVLIPAHKPGEEDHREGWTPRKHLCLSDELVSSPVATEEGSTTATPLQPLAGHRSWGWA